MGHGSNYQTDAYKAPRPPKQHELRQRELIAADYPDLEGRVLDIGCASGNFLMLLSETFPGAKLSGFDLSPELIAAARDRLVGVDVELEVADALEFDPPEGYDVIVASGILSIFEDFSEPLTKWLSWLNPRGSLYVFGMFNPADIDVRVRFRNNFTGGDWEGGLTTYAVDTVSRLLTEGGYKHRFERFDLDVSLPRSDDPIRTYTIACEDGTNLIVNGANIVHDFYFLTIRHPAG